MSGMTHGRVLRIAGPIVLSNATVPLLGAVDTAVIGQLGDAASLGAVGIGAVIYAAALTALKTPEVFMLLRVVRARLGR